MSKESVAATTTLASSYYTGVKKRFFDQRSAINSKSAFCQTACHPVLLLHHTLRTGDPSYGLSLSLGLEWRHDQFLLQSQYDQVESLSYLWVGTHRMP